MADASYLNWRWKQLLGVHGPAKREQVRCLMHSSERPKTRATTHLPMHRDPGQPRNFQCGLFHCGASCQPSERRDWFRLWPLRVAGERGCCQGQQRQLPMWLLECGEAVCGALVHDGAGFHRLGRRGGEWEASQPGYARRTIRRLRGESALVGGTSAGAFGWLRGGGISPRLLRL